MIMIPEPEEIRRRLRVAGASVPALCAVAGINRSIFDRWLWGKSVPSLERARRFAEALEKIEADAATRRNDEPGGTSPCTDEAA